MIARRDRRFISPTVLVVGLTALPLLITLAWQIAIKFPAAFDHGFVLIRLELFLVLLLVAAAAGTVGSTHRLADVGFGRYSSIVLLIACVMSAAIGDSPGLFLQSLTSSAALILCVAAAAGLIVSLLENCGAGLLAFWFVATAAVTLAAWQVGAVPLIARLLVRN